MQRWNWFMTVDVQGKWASVQGPASVRFSDGTLEGSLTLGDEEYHRITATVDFDDSVDATMTSRDSAIAPFELTGTLFKGNVIDGAEPLMLLLTDGTTVLGLSYGPRSHEGNVEL